MRFKVATPKAFDIDNDSYDRRKSSMKKKILAEIEARLGEGYKVEEHEVKKNNGVVMHGIAIKKEGESIAPQIYIDDVDEDEVVDFVLDQYHKVMKSSQFPDVEKLKSLMTKDGILDNVFPSLVNREMNESRFDEIAHTPYLDMEITYKIGTGTGGFVTLTNELLEHAGVSKEELHDAAVSNIQGKAELFNMLDLLPFDKDEMPDGPAIMVLTNSEKTCGAGMLLDEEVIAFLEDKLGDFFILPSSIHELLVIPEEAGKAEELRKMVRQINANEVDDKEVLSNNVYVCREGKVEVA